MEDKILEEIKQIRKLLSELVGTSDLPVSERFSKDAVAKAAREFQKLSIQRGEWISSHDIDSVIRHAPFRAGYLIIEKFGFTNYFSRGKQLYFNKKDLVALNKELKQRNINLAKYSELLADKEKFENLLKRINLPKGTKTKKHFKIPEGLQDINSKPYSAPNEELVRAEIQTLTETYIKFNLSEYVDLFDKKTHALFKMDYWFDRYLKPDLKKFCKDWIFKFNYANYALKRILELKEEANAPMDS